MENLHADYGLAPDSRAQALWSELAAAAALPGGTRGAELGRALNSGHADLLAHVLAPLLEIIRMGDAEDTEYFRAQLAALLLALPPAALLKTLQKLEIPDRRRAINTAARLLSAEALVPLVRAGAAAYEQTISPRFGELLAKLAAGAAGGAARPESRANEGFRELVRHMNERWATSLLNTGSNTFDMLFFEEVHAELNGTRIAPGATRVVQLALETGAVGPMVWLALRSLGETEEGTRRVVELLKGAEPTLASRVITEQIATLPRLALLLRETPIDWAAADALIAQLGVNAARPLTEQLILADARAVRRAIMDHLVQLGPDIRPFVMEHISDERWYVVRNMVVLLREARCYVEPILTDSLAAHAEPRVRREALLLRLERPTARERALSDGLRDADKQVLRTALHAAGNNLPASCVLVLARRLAEPGFPPELRPLALGLLSRSGDAAGLDALLRTVDGGRNLLGRTLLAPKSPDVLAALTGLARYWTRDVRAREFIRLAEKSRDPELLAAIRPAEPEGT